VLNGRYLCRLCQPVPASRLSRRGQKITSCRSALERLRASIVSIRHRDAPVSDDWTDQGRRRRSEARTWINAIYAARRDIIAQRCTYTTRGTTNSLKPRHTRITSDHLRATAWYSISCSTGWGRALYTNSYEVSGGIRLIPEAPEDTRHSVCLITPTPKSIQV